MMELGPGGTSTRHTLFSVLPWSSRKILSESADAIAVVLILLTAPAVACALYMHCCALPMRGLFLDP